MQQSGFFCWHVHHGILFEWCHDYDGRAEYIRTEKPSDEQELRLRLFQPVKGQLPQAVVEAEKAFNEARKAYDEAVKASDEAWGASDEAVKAYDEAWTARDEAVEACREARKVSDEALSNHKDAIEALHAQECLDCPWDGETIFPAA